MDQLEALVLAERVAMVFNSLRPALAGNILVAALGVLIIFPHAPVFASSGWLIGLLAIAAIRWWMNRARDRERPERRVSPSVWARRLFAILAVNGLWWGLFFVLLLGIGDQHLTGFASFVAGGLMAAAVATLGPLRSLFLAFTLPLAICMVAAFFWSGDPNAWAVAGFSAAFEVALIGTAWQLSRIIGRNIELKLQNEALVRSLTTANAQLAETNESLGHEIEERKRAEERSEFLATHDALTELPNRRLQKDRFEQAVARASRNGGSVAILFIDLDRFKEVNDDLGHAVGDGLLRVLADRLRGSLRQSDSVCRHGGDEFLMLIGNATDRATIAGIAERVIQSISTPVEIDGERIQIGCSIGIGLYPSDGEDFDRVVSHADKALYRAKRQGRGRYRFFTRELDLDGMTPLITRAS